MSSIISLGFGLGIASILLGADKPEQFPRVFGRFFTTVHKEADVLHIKCSWLSSVLIIGPLLPILLTVFLAGVFDHSFFPSRPGYGVVYTTLGVLSGIFLLMFLIMIPTGYRCEVSKGHVDWVNTYFGKAVQSYEYPNAVISEFLHGIETRGTPVVTIRFDVAPKEIATATTKFRRNLDGLTPKQFHDALGQYLDDESVDHSRSG